MEITMGGHQWDVQYDPNTRTFLLLDPPYPRLELHLTEVLKLLRHAEALGSIAPEGVSEIVSDVSDELEAHWGSVMGAPGGVKMWAPISEERGLIQDVVEALDRLNYL